MRWIAIAIRCGFRFAKSINILAVVVVLPTPPLPLAMTKIFTPVELVSAALRLPNAVIHCQLAGWGQSLAYAAHR